MGVQDSCLGILGDSALMEQVASELGKILMETRVQEGKDTQSSRCGMDKAGQAEEWWVWGRGVKQC